MSKLSIGFLDQNFASLSYRWSSRHSSLFIANSLTSIIFSFTWSRSAPVPSSFCLSLQSCRFRFYHSYHGSFLLLSISTSSYIIQIFSMLYIIYYRRFFKQWSTKNTYKIEIASENALQSDKIVSPKLLHDHLKNNDVIKH